MNIFQSLSWRIQHPSELENIPKFIPKNTSEIVSFFKPLTDVELSNLKLRLVSEKSETDSNIPGFRPLPPYPSTKLTVDDHKKCLEILQCTLTGANPNTKPELKSSLIHYEKMEPIIKDERIIYTNFVKDKWLTTSVTKCQKIKSEIEDYFITSWQSRSRVFDQYPKYYNQFKMIPLFFKEDIQFEMKLTLNLHEMGTSPYVTVPKINKKRCYIEVNKKPLKTARLLPVSLDNIAEEMAKQCNADVVISTSGLKHLLDNHPPYSNNWNLPVRIKEYCSYKDGKEIKKKIIYIDKALPKNKMNNVQKNYWVLKKLIKTKFTKGVYYSNNTMELPLENDEEFLKNASESDRPHTPVAVNSTHTSGTCIPIVDSGTTVNNENVDLALTDNTFSDNEIENGDETDGSCSELIIDMSENEEEKGDKQISGENAQSELPLPKKRKISEQSDCRITRSMSKLSMSHTSSSSPMLSPRSFSISPPPSSCQSPSLVQSTLTHKSTKPNYMGNKYISYRLWTLACRDDSLRSFTSKKFQFKPIKILIRSKIDACQNNKAEPVIISPKLEYQLEYGAEVCTQGELCREWISSFIWPFSKIFRVRMDPDNLEYIHYDECDLTKIMNDANFLYKQNFNNKWSSLYSVLTELISAPPGDYMLSHTARSATFTSLLVSTQNRSSNTVLNLEDLKQFMTIQDELYPWIPLDSTVILPNNIAQNVVPGLFKGSEKKIVQKTQTRKRKRGAKKKKRKKTKKTAV